MERTLRGVVAEKRHQDMKVVCQDAPAHLKEIWVPIAYNRSAARPVAIGEAGTCCYEVTPTSGLWRFVPDEEQRRG